MPTAETFAFPYLEIGVSTYSSAIFNFLPHFAQKFYSAVRHRDHATVFAMLRDFVLPYVAIRSRRKAVGRPADPVRPPLMDLEPVEVDELKQLIVGRT